MKWHNGNKWVRRDEWFAVPPPKQESMKKAKVWCDNYHFGGRYYFHYTNTRWWFEDEKDAVLFGLTWSGR